MNYKTGEGFPKKFMLYEIILLSNLVVKNYTVIAREKKSFQHLISNFDFEFFIGTILKVNVQSSLILDFS